jgi:hypothetical protein
MRKAIGIGLTFLGLLLVCLAKVGLKIGMKAIDEHAKGAISVAIVVVAIIAGLFVFGYLRKAGSSTLRYGKRWRAPYAEELQETDQRTPILLLRAFDDDEKFDLAPGLQPWRALEEVIVAHLKRVAPVVAIGRPGEWAPPLGAVRLYEDKDWQAKVRELIRKCRLIIFTLGATDGLMWELRQLVEMRVLDRVIFIVPPAPRKEIQRRWEALARQCRVVGNIEVPQTIPVDAVFATVDASGKFIIHTSRGVRGWSIFGCERSDHYTKPLDAILDRTAPDRPAPHRGRLILFLGILSFLPVCFIPAILGLIVLRMGNTDLAKMDAGRMDPAGRSLTSAGRICGIIGVFLCLGLMGLFCLGVFAAQNK